MDRGAWRATVHGVTKSQTRLSGQAQHNGRRGWNSQLVSAYNCVSPTDLLPSSPPFQNLLAVTVK